MKKYLYLSLVITLFVMMANNSSAQSSSNDLGALRTASGLHKVSPDSSEIEKMLQYYDKQIYFTENKGQWPATVLYKADFPLGQAVATQKGMIVGTYDPASITERDAQDVKEEEAAKTGKHYTPPGGAIKGHGWLMNFVNSSPSMSINSKNMHPDFFNYVHGDASKSATHVNNYQEVWYNNLYDHVDVRYYPSAQGTLEYDIVCKPGFDKNNIVLQLDGINKMKVTKNGHLVLNTSVGDMDFPAPVAYQRINGKKQLVNAKYELITSNQGTASFLAVTFKLGKYDASQPLIIDPIALRWATWITNNSSSVNHGHCIWVDPATDYIYIAGKIAEGTLITTAGAFQSSYTGSGGTDMFFGKYSEPDAIGGAGTRIWQTYYGGGANANTIAGGTGDNPFAMQQGPDGNLYVVGYTGSSNFPLGGGTAFKNEGDSINDLSQNTGSNSKIVVLKFDTTGTSFKASIIGGNGNDQPFDLRITSAGNIIVCGLTTSTNLATLFPGSGASNTNNGGNDVLVFEINANLNSILWMKNYGGSKDDQANIMLTDASDNIFVAGQTKSTNFPLSSNARQSTLTGSEDGFIQKLNADGGTVWSSYFNSASKDSSAILCMEFNTTQTEIYFGGITNGLASSNISSSKVYQSTYGGGAHDLFVANMDTNQTFIKATYLGGSVDEINMMGLNVDLNNDVYIFGYSNSTNFPVTSDALQSKLNTTGSGSNHDKTFTKLRTDLDSLDYSTYYGGTDDDYDPVGERGIKFSNCRIYTIVTSESNNIPLTKGALTTSKLSSSSVYEPGLVVWANPPDLIGNTISGSQSVCSGGTPSGFTGSLPSYSLDSISRNNVISAYPVSYGSAASYQWQYSTDSINWTDVSGGTTQNLASSLIGPIYQKTYFRRIINGDACVLAGPSDQTVTVTTLIIPGTANNVTCYGLNNGSITINAANGTSPYKYLWTPGGATTSSITGLAPNTYKVKVTDAGSCVDSSSFVINQPLAPLSATVSSTLATCNTSNGSVSCVPNGGTTPYSFLWNPGGATTSSVTGLPAGIYTVTVSDSNKCTLSLPDTITNNSGGKGGDTTVVACNSFTWYGTSYTTSGSPTHQLINNIGCDSTVTLNLTINHSSSSNNSHTACNSYQWNGIIYTAGGSYSHDCGNNAAGCDSVAYLNLTINYSNSSNNSHTACNSYQWNGTTYTTGGIYSFDAGNNVSGCDSIAYLNLTINYSSSSNNSHTACNSYQWNGISYTTGGSYSYDMGNNVSGCDSIAYLNLTINNTSSSTTYQTACNSYEWNGITYTIGGSYSFDAGNNASGCDSIAYLNLTINYSNSSNTYQTACNSYLWNGITYTTGGSYGYDAGNNLSGCDSVAYLNLTINYSNSSTTYQTACNSYLWNGITYTTGASYSYDAGNNVSGCDSVAYLNLTINYSNSSNTYQTACNSYLWNGIPYTTGGTYSFDAGNNVDGCDSVAYLNLTINNTNSSNTIQTACNSYEWNGITYTTGGSYSYDAGNNVSECDSIAYLNLTINNTSSSTTYQTACNSYEWNGITYTTGGSYSYDAGNNVSGCDSIAYLNLTINNTSSSNNSHTDCNSYLWNGITYTTGGSYSYDAGNNVAECDSVAYLNLTINYTSSSNNSQTACNSYLWNSVTYTTGGSYSYDAGNNLSGCDSVAYLNLTINNTSSSNNSQIACNSYLWNGVTYTTGGSYSFDAGNNVAGCDSVAYLNLTINNINSSNAIQTACNSYLWNGISYTTGGSYSYDAGNNVAGCDSIAYLNLTVNYTSSSNNSHTDCNSYLWNGITYTTGGNYSFDAGNNASGCDSVAYLNLTINYSNSSTAYQTACNGYLWNGITYTTSGSYSYDAGNNASGCDSIAYLNLTINYSNSSTTYQTACNSYLWNGITYTTDGSYSYDAGNNVSRCDSVAYLNLTINYSNSSTTYQTACNSYLWNGITYTTGGSYSFGAGNNASGCDSVAYLNLTINYSNSSTTYQTACNGYLWNGITYTTGGSYSFDAGNNVSGCDSVAYLNLTINNISSSNNSHTDCNSYLWNGITYTTGGSYSFDAGNNASGCDSVAYLNLTINYSNSSTAYQTACNGYLWNGITYTTSGSYSYDAGNNASGCDSIAYLNLTINYSNSSTTYQTACNSYLWNGITYTTGGNYSFDAGNNASGCDSVAYLNLTINYSNSSTAYQTACNGYLWNGITYTTSGSYSYDAGNNASGCDSIAYLNLTINYSNSSTTYQTACNSYLWNGITYTTDGSYSYDAGNNVSRCDSVAYLNLTINYSNSSTTYQTACNSYLWNGITYTTGGSYSFGAGNNASGCDSVAYLNLTINYSNSSTTYQTACNGYLWNGITYTTGGSYSYDAGNNASGCDSVAYLNLTINYSNSSTTYRTACNSYLWNGITYTTGGSYSFDAGNNASGCDSVAYLNLTINYSNSSTTYQTACNGYLWNGITYTTGGSYSYDAGNNASGCDSVAYLNLTINTSPSINISDPVTICQGGSIQICASGADTYTWSNGASTSCITVGDRLQGGQAYSYSVTGTVNGCSGSNESVVYVDSLPTVSITPSNGSPTLILCHGSSVQLCASGAITYSWSNGATTSCITVSTGETYSVVGTNAGNCSSTASVGVTVNSLPPLNININGSTSFCQGGSVQLCVSGASSYLWSNSATTSCITVSTAGTYSVVGTGANGCSATASQGVTVNPNPTVTVTPTGSVCAGNAGLCASGAVSYKWSTNATTSCISVTTNGTYSVVGTNSYGCTAANSASVSLGQLPNCTITGNTTICPAGCSSGNMPGGTTQLCGPDGNYTYLWSNKATTQCITVSQTGTYSVAVTNNSGCSSMCNATVTASTPPSCNISGACNVCQGGSTTLCAPGGYASYLWSTGATTSCITVNKAATYSVTVTNRSGCYSTCSMCVTISSTPPCSITTGCGGNMACTGSTSLCGPSNAAFNTGFLWSTGATSRCITVTQTGTYTLTLTNGSGCSSSCTQQITIGTTPPCTISGSNSVCRGDSASLCAPAGAGLSYSWSTGATTPCIEVKNAATYSVTVANSSGCRSTCSQCVALYSGGTGDTTANICSSFKWYGATYTSSGTATHVFVNGGGCDSTVTLYLTINHSTSGDTTATACNSFTWYGTTYTSSATPTHELINAAGCDSTVTLYLTINYSPIVRINANGKLNLLCTGDPLELCATGATRYTWSNGATTTCISVSAAETYSVVGTNSNGCIATDTLTVIAQRPPTLTIVTISGNTTFCQGDSIELCASGAAVYSWSPSVQVTACIYAKATGTYSVTGTDTITGCSATDTISVTENYRNSSLITANGCNTYIWNGASYTISGTYSYNASPNAAGCDSVAYLSLTIGYPDTSFTSVTACDRYLFRDITYTSSENLYFSGGLNTSGCDSVVNLNLTINHSDTSYTSATGCNSYTWNGSTYTTGGTFSYNASPNAVRCDSVAYLNLTIGFSDTSYTSVTACDRYLFRDITYTSSENLYFSGGLNAAGCDSTINLNLTINHSDTSYTSVTACDSYTWNGVIYTTGGTYSYNASPNASRCDSIAYLVLTINTHPNVTITGDTTLCTGSGNSVQLCVVSGTSYLWSSNAGGATTQCINASSPGKYVVHVTFEGGCSGGDSIYVTTSAPPSVSITPGGSTTFCNGGSVQLCASGATTYLWNNGATTSCITATATGTYSVTGTTGGCSAGNSIGVTVNNSTTSTTTLSECNSYIWNGTTYTISGSYSFNAIPNAAGCDSTAYLDLTINHTRDTTYSVSACSSYLLPWDSTVTQTGEYCHRYQSEGCGSEVCIYVTIGGGYVNCTISGNTSICSKGCGGRNGNSTQLCAPEGNSSYLWSTGATTQCITVSQTGGYSVTVSNNSGCSSSCSTTVTASTPPSCEISGGSSICDGQSTSLCAPAGDGYSYSWSNGATTQCISVCKAGTYSVTVTNSGGCYSTCSKCVKVSSGPSCSISTGCGKNMSCEATTLCGPSDCDWSTSFLWSTGATTRCIDVTASGTYTLTVTNGSGCSSSCCKTVTVGTPPPCTITGNTYICSGECSTLCGPDGDGLSYSWSNGEQTQCIKVTCSGTYNLTVTNGSGCSSMCSVCVTVAEAPVCCISGNLSIMKGQCTTLCATKGCENYLWNNGETTQCITVKCPGTYCVTITNKNGCSSTCSVCVTYDNGCGRESSGADGIALNSFGNIEVSAYPNPFTSLATIEFQRTDVAAHVLIEVYALSGDKVATIFDGEVEAGVIYKAQFDAATLAEGMYIYRIISDDNVVNGKLLLVKN